MKTIPPKSGKSHLVLVINPGSTSTRVALFRGRRCIEQETVRHSARAIATFKKIVDQAPMREDVVRKLLARRRVESATLDAISVRGGLLAPCPAGTYLVGPKMLRDLRAARYGSHASNLGAIIGAQIAGKAGPPVFVVDPVVVDELCDEARFSGIPEITRRALWHTLNQRAMARHVARKLGKTYETSNLIVAHLGGGTSVAAHCRGRAVDVNNAVDGDGPFAAERSGGLPARDVVELARAKPLAWTLKRISGRGGVVAYLGTNDMREVLRRAQAGDKACRDVIAAMAYQIAKEIGSAAAVLGGRVDAVVLTGGLAHARPLVDRIRRRVRFIAPVRVEPGERELPALVDGALRVLEGKGAPLRYPPPARPKRR